MAAAGLSAQPPAPSAPTPTPATTPAPANTAGDDAIEALAPSAGAVCLAEVISTRRYDDTPSDGNAGIAIKVKPIKSSGIDGQEFEVRLTTVHGGLRPRGYVPPPPASEQEVNSWEVGKRYWIAFTSGEQADRYPTSGALHWPEADGKVAAAMEAAIRADRYRWRPEYERGSDVMLEHLVDPAMPDRWQIRGKRRGKLLWEKTVDGTYKGHYFSGINSEKYGPIGVRGRAFPMSTLSTQSEIRVADGNEYGLTPPPSGVASRTNVFELETGRCLIENTGVERKSVHREFDSLTGRLLLEDTVETIPTGGKAFGQREDYWAKKTTRRFDPSTGKPPPVSTEVFRRNPNAKSADERWLPLVEKPGP